MGPGAGCPSPNIEGRESQPPGTGPDTRIARQPQAPPHIACQHNRAYTPGMIRFFDMDDRARLPWRFFGETHAITARA